MYRLHLLLSLSLCANIQLVISGCSISLSDLQDPQPLLLRQDAGSNNAIDAFYLPDDQGVIEFEDKEEIKIECPNGFIKIDGVSTKIRSQIAACAKGTKLTIDKKQVEFSTISCTRHSKHIARFTGNACLKTMKEAEIGFELQNGDFIRHIELCFDPEEQNTKYTVYHLTANIAGYQVNYPRVEFTEAGFYDLGDEKLNDLYGRNLHREKINALVGLPLSSTKYVHATNDYYLARGHLTAKTDFVYGSQQRLTFYYINAAPQWQTHNAGNWLALENSVRNYASEKNVDLIVYTGTHGVTTLPHEKTGEDVEIYLHEEEDGNKAIPIPQLFWKVAYDPISEAGIAFIGVNNPYHEDVSGDVICKDICDQIDWVKWKKDELKPGYSYCCTVASFRQVVKTLPTFKVSKLLQ